MGLSEHVGSDFQSLSLQEDLVTLDLGENTDFNAFARAYSWMAGYLVAVRPRQAAAFDAFVNEVGPGARWSFSLQPADANADPRGLPVELAIEEIESLLLY